MKINLSEIYLEDEDQEQDYSHGQDWCIGKGNSKDYLNPSEYASKWGKKQKRKHGLIEKRPL